MLVEVWFQHSKVSSERSNKRACVTHRTRNSIRVSKFYRRLQRLRVDRPCEAELRRVLQFRILVEICLRNFDSSVDNSREPSRYFFASTVNSHFLTSHQFVVLITRAPNVNFRHICSEDDLRSRIFGIFVVKFRACLPLLGFSNI